MYYVWNLLQVKRFQRDERFWRGKGYWNHKIHFFRLENGRSNPKDAKLQKIADLFGVTAEYIRTGKNTNEYYTNNETAQVAQEIFENKELRALFDVQKDMDPADLKALHSMALALKRKERGDIDDTWC